MTSLRSGILRYTKEKKMGHCQTCTCDPDKPDEHGLLPSEHDLLRQGKRLAVVAAVRQRDGVNLKYAWEKVRDICAGLGY